MKIHGNTVKILKKVLNYNLINEKDLNKNILDHCDSLKFLEILIETEKRLKKKN